MKLNCTLFYLIKFIKLYFKRFTLVKATYALTIAFTYLMMQQPQFIVFINTVHVMEVIYPVDLTKMTLLIIN